MNAKFKRLNTTNYAEDKGACKWFQTRSWNKQTKSYENKFDNALEFFELMKDYKQVSTGLNHTEREVVVIDVDEDVRNPYYWSVLNLPIAPNRYTKNLSNGHTQFHYYLDKPISNESNEWKRLMAFSRKYGDPRFTGWQMRNPFFKGNKLNRYEIGEISNKQVTLELMLSECPEIQPNANSPPSFSICVNVPQGNPNITTLNKGKKLNYDAHSRNQETFYALGRWMASDNGYRMGEEELFLKWKEFNIQICKEMMMSNSPEAEGRSTVRCLMNYRSQGRLTFRRAKNGNEVSQRIRKERANNRKLEAITYHLDGKSVNEIAEIMGMSTKQIRRYLSTNIQPNANSSSSFSICVNVPKQTDNQLNANLSSYSPICVNVPESKQAELFTDDDYKLLNRPYLIDKIYNRRKLERSLKC